MTNVVLLRGTLCRPAATTELPSGDRLLGLEVSTRPPSGRVETVPVCMSDPPAWACDLDTGAEVAVLGRVRRRFFRAGGATQSRTEVVASRLVRASAAAELGEIAAEASRAIAAPSQRGSVPPLGSPWPDATAGPGNGGRVGQGGTGAMTQEAPRLDAVDSRRPGAGHDPRSP